MSVEAGGKTRILLERGVVIPCPASVEIEGSIVPERIAAGVVIHSGSRLRGPLTSIGPGCRIGAEAPATIENCQLANHVSLKGGCFSEATFLDGSSVGSSAHIRAGSLLEEEANAAHAVGFKQTILFPYVTAGSLINFCDCLMAGGTSRKNHSEIGSSYIHFNFTPHQDKATASLIGDVPHGVLLNRNPIFLGGQGGLVGPVRIAFGTVIAAGAIHRRDVLAENQLITAARESSLEPRRYIQRAYRSIHRIVVNNLVYIGNIWALREWYRHVRRLLMPGDLFTEACRQGALVQLDCILEERIRRLKELADKMAASLEIAREEIAGDLPEEPYAQQKALMEGWPEMEQLLKQGPAPRDGAMLRDNFLERLSKTEMGDAYAHTIRRLDEAARNAASSWLQSMVDSAVSLWTRI